MSNDNNKILEIAAILAIGFLLWRFFARKKPAVLSKQPEPAMTPEEVLAQFANKKLVCDKILYRPLSPYGPYASNLLGEGWCFRGDGSFLDGREGGFGDKYADEQANKYTQIKQDEAIRNTNKQIIQFRLINSTSTKITTGLLDTISNPLPAFIAIPDVPVASAASNIGLFGFTANFSASDRASGYYLDIATDSGFLSYVSGFQNKDVGNVIYYAINGLDPNTTYYYRVRAYNSSGTSDNSGTISVITLDEVVIGTQTWKLFNVADNIVGSRVFDDDEANRAIYGGLYQWSMIAAIEALYPGYHVPTLAEWNTLMAYLGGTAIAGGHMKETGINHWLTPNTGADNNSKFTGLGAGVYGVPTATYYYLKEQSFLMVADLQSSPPPFMYIAIIDYNNAVFQINSTAASNFFISVRLIKD